MSKLLKLKKWLTLQEAASHLEIVFGEAITKADVLRLALDGTLTLSLYSPSYVLAKRAELTPLSNPGKFWADRIINGNSYLSIPDDKCFCFDGHGVFDLPMFGGEKLCIEAEYYKMQHLDLNIINHEWIIVRLQNGQLFELAQYHKSETLITIPVTSFPEDGLLVVRTDALFKLENSVNSDQEKPEKLLSTTERTSLLTVIAALCDHSKIRYQERGSAARIARLTEASGVPVSEDTISKILKKIPNALESRIK